ncbi:YicC/YloC family endoribonuclease [Avibacterium paragallinarum]|uniref:YicC family protein n=2 Tax=Gammaproteobacteria TaxID=1236 RepID=A0AAE5WIJ8_AVIPA|nr:YicC/YloC family endoribonuclease [Avibacterium paragallinarum]MEE3608459.1 YicC/YloC family endoribonuclease [Avibacterium paragallinarum]MEE3620595.1 YicC/YloC family endoribonuclease [Avibacterium paragallinarum]MEE3667897.1 YicC/YloC family endoribonuclease [Avibacterium paragallinarum]MEE3680152.1 YicC/YloC family endoribonuclease [Avibacterium paragallinarum]MEE4385251.1 YicC/YloC family endoribonuclease [Avibacterium paragallinarum]
MIYSMTAFARYEIKQDWGNAVWEIRSVNQRYLETFFRLPEPFRGLENGLREKLRQRLTRGKVECSLRFEGKPQTSEALNLNQALAQQVIASLQWLKQQAGEGEINLTDVLRYPGVVETPEQDLDRISQALLAGFEQALAEFIAMRGREGEKLHDLIEQRLAAITLESEKVRSKMPEILQWQRERLQQRFDELQLQADPQRLEQEMVLLAQRIDVAEELDRLQLHVKETQRILHKGGAVGRKLDFMMQELNRESNTLASKSINAEVTNAAVELKVLIEQMREQIQNLE